MQDFLDDIKPTTIQSVPVLKRAADLSILLKHHLFDTLYHAVALEEHATLVTADEAYFAKAVLCVEDFERFTGIVMRA